MSSASVWYYCKKIIPQKYPNANQSIKSSIFPTKIVKCESEDNYEELNLNTSQINSNKGSYFTRMITILQIPFEY
jgi:hypothetical protein